MNRDLLNRPEAVADCPWCGAPRDSAAADCDRCDYAVGRPARRFTDVDIAELECSVGAGARASGKPRVAPEHAGPFGADWLAGWDYADRAIANGAKADWLNPALYPPSRAACDPGSPAIRFAQAIMRAKEEIASAIRGAP